MHQKNIITAGRKLVDAQDVLVMVHGRGATSEDILSIAPHLEVDGFALLAPQATGYSWYPYSFLFPPQQNEPWLSSALDLLKEIVFEIEDNGIQKDHIYFAGFSQGACLLLEFIARNPSKFGGLAAFSGGLIGDDIDPIKYDGDLIGTPIFIGSGDPDPYIPVERVEVSSKVLKKMKANVVTKIYPGIGHTITKEEIAEANEVVFRKKRG